jgi:hypothetical protein
MEGCVGYIVTPLGVKLRFKKCNKIDRRKRE